jgi:hypothetical protein
MVEVSLERAIVAYLKLSRSQFCENNPTLPHIFAAAGTALVTRMWVEGIDYVPATFYIALIGEPRAGKSAFIRTYLRLFDGTDVGNVPVGSPEAMLKAINDVRHGYVWYDEVSHLAKLLDSYMGTLPSILNRAYYLDELAQVRMNKQKSVVVPAESYFIHVYFAGTPADWQLVEKKAVGGFIRRTLVIPVRGIIPFFSAKRPSREDRELAYGFLRWIRHIYKLLTLTRFTVYLPQFQKFGDVLQKEQMDNEKKSMVEEYLYKILAGRVVNNLITFDLAKSPDELILNDILYTMRDNAEAQGIRVEFGDPSRPPVEVVVDATGIDEEVGDPPAEKITSYIPPRFAYMTLKLLLNTVRSQQLAPDEITTKNVERIQRWLESGGSTVVSKRTFVRDILVLRKASEYEPVLQILQDTGHIRVVDWVYKNRKVQYVVLNPREKICANCAYFMDLNKCPKLKGVLVQEDVYGMIKPWESACDKFELAEDGEDEG